MDENHNVPVGEYSEDELTPSSPILFEDEECEGYGVSSNVNSSPLYDSLDTQPSLYPFTAPFDAKASTKNEDETLKDQQSTLNTFQIDLITDLLELIFTRTSSNRDETLSQRFQPLFAASQVPNSALATTTTIPYVSPKFLLSDSLSQKSVELAMKSTCLHERLTSVVVELDVIFDKVFGTGLIRRLAITEICKTFALPRGENSPEQHRILDSSNSICSYSFFGTNNQMQEICSILQKVSSIFLHLTQEKGVRPKDSQFESVQNLHLPSQQILNGYTFGLSLSYLGRLQVFKIVLKKVTIESAGSMCPHLLFTSPIYVVPQQNSMGFVKGGATNGKSVGFIENFLSADLYTTTQMPGYVPDCKSLENSGLTMCKSALYFTSAQECMITAKLQPSMTTESYQCLNCQQKSATQHIIAISNQSSENSICDDEQHSSG